MKEQLKLKWQKHNRDNGLSWNEVAVLVDEVWREASRLPDSIQEALNSGDGTYRP